MSMIPVGAASLVFVDGFIVGLRCSKHRGIILPGGKVEEYETYKNASERELLEETGLQATSSKLIFHGMGDRGVYTYTYLTTIRQYVPIQGDAGEVMLVTWNQLLTSRFCGYYDALRETYNVSVMGKEEPLGNGWVSR